MSGRSVYYENHRKSLRKGDQMRKKIIILVILVLLLAGGGFYAYQYFTGPEYVVGKALEANNINDVKAYIKENSTDVDKTD